MEFYKDPIFLVALATLLATCFGVWLTFWIRQRDKHLIFRRDYNDHLRDLVNYINDSTRHVYNNDRVASEYAKTIHASPSKPKILQHFYTYQTKTGTKIYDRYRNLLILKEGKFSYKTFWTGEELKKMQRPDNGKNDDINNANISFSEEFLRFVVDVNQSFDSTFGVCQECIHTCKPSDKKYYDRILQDKEKSDPHAWDDTRWN